ncbi:MAG: DMT family transporter [Actinomycetota bacterium]|nr:DMT family transporter [Actinomycetota bacterium]
MAGVAILWGTIGLLVRQVDLPATAIAGVRVWLGAAVLGAWLARRRRPAARSAAALLSARPVAVLTLGVLLAVHWVALVAALQRAPIGVVLLVTYLAPVGVAALAPRALGERVPPRSLAALALAVVGVALVATPSLGTPDAPGLALAALAGITLIAMTLLSKPLAENFGGANLAACQLAVAGVVLIPVAATAGWGAPAPSWAWLVVLGVVHTGFAMGAYLGALAVLPVTTAGVLLYLEPVSAVLVGWLLLAETPTPATLVGGTLIVVAGALVLAPSGGAGPPGLGRRRRIQAGVTGVPG